MAEPFIGEIRAFGFNFPPRGWLTCDGSLLPIAQFQTLFAILGTTYGGDGRTNFGLPDLRGRVPVHRGGSTVLGQKDGAETVTLQANELPSHSHGLVASADPASTNIASGSVLANPGGGKNLYGPAGASVAMSNDSIANGGGGQAHNNMQPYLVINYCIAIDGLFPSRN
jgi:microcystin-dependent protein